LTSGRRSSMKLSVLREPSGCRREMKAPPAGPFRFRLLT